MHVMIDITIKIINKCENKYKLHNEEIDNFFKLNNLNFVSKQIPNLWNSATFLYI